LSKPLHNNDYKRLIRRLRDARKEAGITQQKLADELECSQSFVAKYEGLERRLDVVEFVRIAHLLKADPLQIIREELKKGANLV